MSVPKKILIDINVLEELIDFYRCGAGEISFETQQQLRDDIERARKTR